MLSKITIIAKDNFFKAGLTELIKLEGCSFLQKNTNKNNCIEIIPELIFIEKDYFDFFICGVTKGLSKNAEVYIFTDRNHIFPPTKLPPCVAQERVLDKKISLTELRLAISNILSKTINSRHQKGSFEHCNTCLYHTPLTNAQLRVANCIHSGLDYKSIANKLGISYKTVLSHKAHIIKKYNIRNKSEFNLILKSIIKAQRKGLYLNTKST